MITAMSMTSHATASEPKLNAIPEFNSDLIRFIEVIICTMATLKGLTNPDNTCFLNAILQPIYSLASFREFIIQCPPQKTLIAAFATFLQNSHKRINISGTKLKSLIFQLSREYFDPDLVPGTQQDSREFLGYVIQLLQMELPHHNELQQLNDLFQFEYVQTRECLNCRDTQPVVVKNHIFDLHFPEDIVDDVSIQQMLTKECVSDPFAFQHGTACSFSRHVREFTRVPKCFILVLKRYQFNSNNRAVVIRKKVHFNENLRVMNFEYRLKAVVRHEGGMNSGHYTCTLRNEGILVHINDTQITPLPAPAEFNDRGDVYILFYEKNEDSNSFDHLHVRPQMPINDCSTNLPAAMSQNSDISDKIVWKSVGRDVTPVTENRRNETQSGSATTNADKIKLCTGNNVTLSSNNTKKTSKKLEKKSILETIMDSGARKHSHQSMSSNLPILKEKSNEKICVNKDRIATETSNEVFVTSEKTPKYCAKESCMSDQVITQKISTDQRSVHDQISLDHVAESVRKRRERQRRYVQAKRRNRKFSPNNSPPSQSIKTDNAKTSTDKVFFDFLGPLPEPSRKRRKPMPPQYEKVCNLMPTSDPIELQVQQRLGESVASQVENESIKTPRKPRAQINREYYLRNQQQRRKMARDIYKNERKSVLQRKKDYYKVNQIERKSYQKKYLKVEYNRLRNRSNVDELLLEKQKKLLNKKRANDRFKLNVLKKYENLIRALSRKKLVKKCRRNAKLVRLWFHFINDFCLQFVCTCCLQIFSRHSVMKANVKKFSLKVQEYFNGRKSVDNCEWLCRTCKKHLANGSMPPLAASNGFLFPNIPPELEDCRLIEEKFLAIVSAFIKVMERPYGGQLACRGGLVNVPSDPTNIVRMVPSNAPQNGVIGIAFMKRLRDKFPHMLSFARPDKILKMARVLTRTYLYRSRKIQFDANWKIENLDEELAYLFENNAELMQEPENHQKNPTAKQSSVNISETGSMSDEDVEGNADQPAGNYDTMVNQYSFELNKTYKVAPSEKFKPLSIFTEENAEREAYPSVYCGEPQPKRTKKVSYGDECKAHFRSIDRRVARHPELPFWKFKKTQIYQSFSKAQIYYRNRKGVQMTAQELLSGGIDNLLLTDEAFAFLKKQRLSPAYYKDLESNIFAWIRQFGKATFFTTLTMAEHRWVDLLRILYIHKNPGSSPTDEFLKNLKKTEKEILIKSDPALIVMHFHERLNYVLKNILRKEDSPIGKVLDHFGIIEAQFRGSLHCHLLCYVDGAPVPDVQSDEEIIRFVDQCISTSYTLPDIPGVTLSDEDRDLPSQVQLHRHTQTCKKGRKPKCRFGFSKPPMPRTVIARMRENVDRKEKLTLKKRFNHIMQCVDKLKRGRECKTTFEEFLSSTGLTEDEYIEAVMFNVDRDTIILKREPNAVRVNEYNPLMLYLWRANMDIQFVMNVYATAKYIASYMAKPHKGVSELLKVINEEMPNLDLSSIAKLRKLASKFVTSTEVSIQEVCVMLLQLPLIYTTRQVIFVDTNRAENRSSLIKSEAELERLPADSVDVTCLNHLRRYTLRPDALKNVCLADFFSKYVLCSERKSNYNFCDGTSSGSGQSDNETSKPPLEQLPQVKFKLSNGEYIRYISETSDHKVLRYNIVSVNKDPEEHYRQVLTLFLPFKEESQIDVLGASGSYLKQYEKFKDTVEANRQKYDKYRKEVEEAEDARKKECAEDVQHYAAIIAPNFQAQEEYQLFGQPKVITHNEETRDSIEFLESKKIPFSEHLLRVCSLNNQQQRFFYEVIRHAKNISEEQRLLFLTGSAGTGKSLLVRCLYQELIRIFEKTQDNIMKPTVALAAPTGLAALNIGGTTLHSLLGFKVGDRPSDILTMMHRESFNSFRTNLCDLKVLIIDEISMVGADFLHSIDIRLQTLFGTRKSFGGLTVILVGDLLQLRPVSDSDVYKLPKISNAEIIGSVWNKFEYFELTEIMRQDEKSWCELLARLRINSLTVEDALRIDQLIKNDLPDAQRACHTNKKVTAFNQFQVKQLEYHSIAAVDYVKEGSCSDEIQKKLLAITTTMLLHEKANLLDEIEIAEGAPYFLTNNVDITDGLLNGAMCTARKIIFSEKTKQILCVWVQFEREDIGRQLRARCHDNFKHFTDDKLTPIKPITLDFRVKQSKNITSSFKVWRRQFPLSLAFAFTIHKVQGRTFDKIQLDLQTKPLVYGMHYVALSRSRTESGIQILNSFYHDRIAANKDAIEEIERMRIVQPFQSSLRYPLDFTDKYKIVFYNVQSLSRHWRFIERSLPFQSADIILLCETFLYPGATDNVHFEDFTYLRFDFPNATKGTHTGMAALLKTPTDIQFYTSFVDYNIQYILLILKSGYSILGVHRRSSDTSEFTFKASIKTHIDHFKPNVIMGDFNISIHDHEHPMVCLLQSLGLTFLTSEATTDGNTTLDLVFVKEFTNETCVVIESPFSYHKPVFLVVDNPLQYDAPCNLPNPIYDDDTTHFL